MRKSTVAVLFATLLASTAGAQQKTDEECRAAGNSTQREPSWWAAACGHTIPASARQVVKRPNVIGDAAFHVNLRATPDALQTFALPSASAATTVASVGAQVFYGLEHDNATGVMYGLDNATLQLGTVDKTTAAFTSLLTITGMPVGASTTGLAFQSWAAGPVYVSTATDLYTINTTTGAATLVGPFGTTLMIDIAINNAGQMYGHDIGSDSLYSINTATGAATLIGLTGHLANFAQSIDFDKSTGILYGWIYIGTGVNQFVQFDLATGAGTILNTPTNIEAEGALLPVALERFSVE
ncbi:MAG: hypothetical protein IPP07_06605 [Holophagales bacterium]|jgi:hypothetical protein|nr:hypothetical protein [Holophagales bacterium]